MKYVKVLKIPVLDGQRIMKLLKKNGGLGVVSREIGISQSHLTNILKSTRYRSENPVAQKILNYVGSL